MMKMSSVSPPGEVQVFDLGRRSLRPVATLERGGGGGGVAATSLAFNAQNPQLLAVGRSDGTVDIWHLSTDLTEQRPQETSQLEQVANQAEDRAAPTTSALNVPPGGAETTAEVGGVIRSVY